MKDHTVVRKWQWVRDSPASVDKGEKARIVDTCDRFITEVLKPRFLPAIRPTEFNYPVDIYGKWHGGRYRFIQRFRSDSPDAISPEFEVAFARIDCVGPDRFDVMWLRHTGQWWRLYESVSLAEALECIEKDGHLQPV
jgi:hypothetical protein